MKKILTCYWDENNISVQEGEAQKLFDAQVVISARPYKITKVWTDHICSVTPLSGTSYKERPVIMGQIYQTPSEGFGVPEKVVSLLTPAKMTIGGRYIRFTDIKAYDIETYFQGGETISVTAYIVPIGDIADYVSQGAIYIEYEIL